MLVKFIRRVNEYLLQQVNYHTQKWRLSRCCTSLTWKLKRTRRNCLLSHALYNQVDRKKYNIEFSGLSFDYWLAGVRHQFDIFHKADSLDELFIYNPILCDRLGLYDDEFGDFGDNALRFGLFFICYFRSDD